MKKLSILIPHYTESVEEVRPLLDSIQFQQNVDLGKVEVIICNDGPDAVELPVDFLDRYDYDIKYYRLDKGGVSRMRNAAFSYSSGDYVMWCDADDQFYHCLAFWFIFREMDAYGEVMVNGIPVKVVGFDALRSVFLEEGRHPETGEVFFFDRSDGFQFVHGAVYNREFLIRNGIGFFDECTIHEDNVLYAQVAACTENIKWCPVPFYLWKWRDNSVCRRDPLYLKKTYIDLIKSQDLLVDWMVSKSKFDKAREIVVSLVFDAYYNVICHPSWKDIGTQEYRDEAERKFSEFYRKNKRLWDEAPDQMKMGVSNNIRQRVVMEGMAMETETLSNFLSRMES